MMYQIGDGIISPLGMTTEENYQAVRAGLTGIQQFPAGFRGLSDSVLAALISPKELENFAVPYCGARTHMMSRYQQAISAVLESAVSNTMPDIYRDEIFTSRRVALIFCTTKGDVDLLCELGNRTTAPRLYPWHAPQCMMEELELPGKPYVVMNSTLSGLQAQMLADRLLCKGSPYDFAVIVGVELINMFTIFLLKEAGLVSDTFVRPYDKAGTGTNPGESASCAIYVSEERFNKDRKSLHMPSVIKFRSGVVTTDPCFRKNPNPEGIALQRAIKKVMAEENIRNLSFINVQSIGLKSYHNMISVAIERSGLKKVHVNCFEANFGHSSGSSSLMNSILGSKSLERKEILPTLGYTDHGVEGKILINTQLKSSLKHSFISLSSGFGGVNAVALFTKEK